MKTETAKELASMKHHLFAVTVLIGVVGLAGCGSDREAKAEKVERVCPKFGVLLEGQHVTLYRPGAGREKGDVAYEIDVTSIKGKCRFRDDGTRMTFRVTLGLTAQKGPAATETTVVIPVFAAVTRRNQAIVAKESRSASLSFRRGEVLATKVDIDEFAINLGPQESGQAFEVLAGIQLTPDQLRERRAR